MTVISAMPDDTVQACLDRSTTRDVIGAYIACAYYVQGMGKPHYLVPSTKMDARLSRQDYWKLYYWNRQTQ